MKTSASVFVFDCVKLFAMACVSVLLSNSIRKASNNGHWAPQVMDGFEKAAAGRFKIGPNQLRIGWRD